MTQIRSTEGRTSHSSPCCWAPQGLVSFQMCSGCNFRNTSRINISETSKGLQTCIRGVSLVLQFMQFVQLVLNSSFPKEAPTKMASWHHGVPGLSGMLQAAAAPYSKQGSFAVSSPPIGRTEPTLPTRANRRTPNKKDQRRHETASWRLPPWLIIDRGKCPHGMRR